MNEDPKPIKQAYAYAEACPEHKTRVVFYFTIMNAAQITNERWCEKGKHKVDPQLVDIEEIPLEDEVKVKRGRRKFPWQEKVQ